MLNENDLAAWYQRLNFGEPTRAIIDQVLAFGAQIAGFKDPSLELLLESAVPLLNDRIDIVAKIAVADACADTPFLRG